MGATTLPGGRKATHLACRQRLGPAGLAAPPKLTRRPAQIEATVQGGADLTWAARGALQPAGGAPGVAWDRTTLTVRGLSTCRWFHP